MKFLEVVLILYGIVFLFATLGERKIEAGYMYLAASTITLLLAILIEFIM